MGADSLGSFRILQPFKLMTSGQMTGSQSANLISDFFKPDLRLAGSFKLPFPLLQLGSGGLHVDLLGGLDQLSELLFLERRPLNSITNWIRAVSKKPFPFNRHS